MQFVILDQSDSWHPDALVAVVEAATAADALATVAPYITTPGDDAPVDYVAEPLADWVYDPATNRVGGAA